MIWSGAFGDEFAELLEAFVGVVGDFDFGRAVPIAHSSKEGESDEFGGKTMIGSPRSDALLAVGMIRADFGWRGSDDQDEVAHRVVPVRADGVFDLAVEFVDAGPDSGQAVEAPSEVGAVAGVAGGVVGGEDGETAHSSESEALVARGKLEWWSGGVLE